MKTAVVLFNLGGPDTPEAIAPFLYNLFADKRIIGLPAGLRHMVAKLISTTRAPKVKPLYAEMGGASPILKNTQAQAEALQSLLNEQRVFICMRYWNPRAAEVVKQVQAYAPDNIILLPLYPQFSTTTSESSFVEWDTEAQKAGLNIPTERVCCYPHQSGFIDAMVELIHRSCSGLLSSGTEEGGLLAANTSDLRILFSAHGLPKKIIDKKGDPYVSQVEMTAKAIVEKLGIPNLDWKVTYQSRVGPVEWVKPYTDVEIRNAGAEKKNLVLVPIAFVSEHIETLVELDVENKNLALESGCVSYTRIPTVSTHPKFIAGLAELVRKPVMPNLCPVNCFACPCKN
jgi:ferrochelatase